MNNNGIITYDIALIEKPGVNGLRKLSKKSPSVKRSVGEG